MRAVLSGVDFHLPEKIITNEDLQAEFPDWSVEKIEKKTGIRQRHIAAEGETAGDLAIAAARKMFQGGRCVPGQIDFLLFCTQTPDYLLPTTACLIQQELGLPKSCGALDFNLGCSGFVYGLSLAKGLIESSQAKKVLLLCGDTYSKLLAVGDRSVRTLFGDAGTASLVESEDVEGDRIGPFVFGTDGSGGKNLIVPHSGMRKVPREKESGSIGESDANPICLHMNGPEIFNFTLDVVPSSVNQLLESANMQLENVDLVVMHQANRYMLEHLRKRMGIPIEKFMYSIAETGNTVSSTIPIALAQAEISGRLAKGDIVMLVGFGVGYSWGATLLRW